MDTTSVTYVSSPSSPAIALSCTSTRFFAPSSDSLCNQSTFQTKKSRKSRGEALVLSSKEYQTSYPLAAISFNGVSGGVFAFSCNRRANSLLPERSTLSVVHPVHNPAYCYYNPTPLNSSRRFFCSRESLSGTFDSNNSRVTENTTGH